MNFTIEEIITLMDKLSQTGLGELTVSDKDTILRIKAKKTTYATTPQTVCSTTCIDTPVTVSNITTDINETTAFIPTGSTVVSPIVGTFYAASSPDKPPYVKVGSKVKKGDVLFVIESMKLMNEITSEFDGEVTQILVENAAGIEFSQPIMVIN